MSHDILNFHWNFFLQVLSAFSFVCFLNQKLFFDFCYSFCFEMIGSHILPSCTDPNLYCKCKRPFFAVTMVLVSPLTLLFIVLFLHLLLYPSIPTTMSSILVIKEKYILAYFWNNIYRQLIN